MNSDRYSRQTFLGLNSQERIEAVTVGVIGLGGGGSHVVQQLAHIGFRNYVLYDDDVVEESNLNRLVGGTTLDVAVGSPKLLVAKRSIFGLRPDANVVGVSKRWQEEPEPLRRCHIVVGCVDTYLARHELEIVSRRYLFNYIDIGMDVHGEETPVIGGQVLLSTPGGPCMRCMGFLTDDRLSQEAAKYGNVGGNPQVVWPNGVLASTAVGMVVDLVTNWTAKSRAYEHLVYNGNSGTVARALSLKGRVLGACPHYAATEVGDPVLQEF